MGTVLPSLFTNNTYHRLSLYLVVFFLVESIVSDVDLSPDSPTTVHPVFVGNYSLTIDNYTNQAVTPEEDNYQLSIDNA